MANNRRTRGTSLIVLASLLGLTVSLYDFTTPATGIDHTAGVGLVVVSNTLMLGAAIAMGIRGARVGVLMILILLDIAGTCVAGWFLESPLLMAAMLIAMVGWFARIGAPAPRTAS